MPLLSCLLAGETVIASGKAQTQQLRHEGPFEGLGCFTR
jgi:hypothetical protein